MKRVSILTSREELADVKKGDEIEDNMGKGGEVAEVEVIHYNSEDFYYYKIKDDGTILIIK